MSLSLRRRRKPKTIVGKIIRAWPKIRLGLKVVRVVRRARRVLKFGLAGLLVLLALRVVRRLRSRGATEPLPPPPPPPTPTPAAPPAPRSSEPHGPATSEAGMEASPVTRTEQELEAEKATEQHDVDAPNEGAPGGAVNPDVPPPQTHDG